MNTATINATNRTKFIKPSILNELAFFSKSALAMTGIILLCASAWV